MRTIEKHNGNDTGIKQIIIPRVSSESRDYVPMGYVNNNTVISDSAIVIYNAPIWLLGLLQSRMHMVWLRSIGGKLKPIIDILQVWFIILFQFKIYQHKEK